jgi:hypothetical protein
VLTLPSAAKLLAGACDTAGLTALARSAGFSGDAAPLDASSRSSLGLPAYVRAASVLAGRGSLRALCVEASTASLNREAVATIATRVQRRSPFALWLVFATERGANAVAIAAATLTPAPRASLLVTSRERVLDSDAEALRSLAAASDGVDLLVHARWCEILGREAVTNRFFRALEHAVGVLASSVRRDVPEDDARTLALLTSTRLLFLAFLEARGWLDGDYGFLRRTWDACVAGRGGYHRHVLLPLCFGTLNTPRSRRAAAARAFGSVPFLNGGLFTRTAVERKHARTLFPDAALGTLVDSLLGRWRFTVREQSSAHTEVAVDPEMLGRAFESLMASRERRVTGTFYTPRALVARVFDGALGAAFDTPEHREAFTAIRSGRGIPTSDAERMRARLAGLRVLDPTCGSGAFLVHALHELAALRVASGDRHEGGALHRDILARQLFGVDREPTAVWLCELRLWLAVVVETDVTDPRLVPPLPNLDAQIRVGDALAGDAFVTGVSSTRATPMTRLRERYARATGARKRNLAAVLARAERRAALDSMDARLASTAGTRRDILTSLRGRDLFGERMRPAAAAKLRLEELRREARELRAARRATARGGSVAFDFAAQFADVGSLGGFDVVIGNPPWVRLHRIPASERVQLRARFRVYREAGWPDGAVVAGASPGFAAQVDLAALFIERALALAKPGGTIALLVPAKLWRSLAGGGVRRLLLDSTQIKELEDWSESRTTFDAAVYPSLVVATNAPAAQYETIRVAEHHRDNALQWLTARGALAFDDTPGAPWLWLPSDARDGFDRMRAAGEPLAAYEARRPRLGVKCGCNDAFIVRRNGDGHVVARDGRRGTVEADLVRPLLRGDAVTPWRVAPNDDAIVFPCDDRGQPLRALPPLARKWLLRWRARLVARTDGRGQAAWWSLFRLEAARHDRPRVVWADLSRTPRAAVLPAGDRTVPINTCYVVAMPTIEHAHALAAWLNGPLAAAWLAALAEPARGGYRRLLGWTVSLLPVPRDWDRAMARMAGIGARACAGETPDREELLDAELEALGLPRRAVEALLTWGHR